MSKRKAKPEEESVDAVNNIHNHNENNEFNESVHLVNLGIKATSLKTLKPVIKFVLIDGELPKKANDDNGNACYDVIAVDRIIKPEYVEYRLGFKTEIPENMKGVIVPRSSISNHSLIMANSPGQIDSSYRGEWIVRFKILPTFNIHHVEENGEKKLVNILSSHEYSNTNKPTIKLYNVGDKIAQIYFQYVTDVEMVETKELTKTNREDGGFGSTGV